jgi:hypothetical protein
MMQKLFLTVLALTGSSSFATQINCVFSYTYGIHTVDTQTFLIDSSDQQIDLHFGGLKHIGAIATLKGTPNMIFLEIEELRSGIRAASRGPLATAQVTLFRDGHHQRFHLQCF